MCNVQKRGKSFFKGGWGGNCFLRGPGGGGEY